MPDFREVSEYKNNQYYSQNSQCTAQPFHISYFIVSRRLGATGIPVNYYGIAPYLRLFRRLTLSKIMACSNMVTARNMTLYSQPAPDSLFIMYMI